MKRFQPIKAFFQLIRFPNLVFIALTQCLFYFLIIVPFCTVDGQNGHLLQRDDFFLLLASSVLIAAAGYIINDYFDIDIDNVNKPDRLIVGKLINRRWAMLLHLVLSLVGLYLTAIVAMHLNNLLLLALNFLSVLLLLLYSSTFKKRLLIGNIIISVLTAWVVGVLFITELKLNDAYFMRQHQDVLKTLYKYTLVYAGFAFIVSLIREVVKDLEDMTGDRKFGCTTMPILWGIPSTKIFIGVWFIVLAGILAAFTLYTILNTWFWAISVFGGALVVYALFLLQKLYQANATSDYSKLSGSIKLLMLMGILSMLLYFFQ